MGMTNWPRDPWTVVCVEHPQSLLHDHMYYAFNTRTGQRMEYKETYDEALASIPEL